MSLFVRFGVGLAANYLPRRTFTRKEPVDFFLDKSSVHGNNSFWKIHGEHKELYVVNA